MFFCGPPPPIFGGPANLCDSVATECLPAAESKALQQPSSSPPPPRPSLPLARRLPADTYRLPPPSQEQLFQNWPTCIQFTTTAAPESVLNNLLRLFPARITLPRDGDGSTFFRFSRSHLWICHCALVFTLFVFVAAKRAVVVVVVVVVDGDADDDCVLIIMILFFE